MAGLPLDLDFFGKFVFHFSTHELVTKSVKNCTCVKIYIQFLQEFQSKVSNITPYQIVLSTRLIQQTFRYSKRKDLYND